MNCPPGAGVCTAGLIICLDLSLVAGSLFLGPWKCPDLWVIAKAPAGLSMDQTIYGERCQKENPKIISTVCCQDAELYGIVQDSTSTVTYEIMYAIRKHSVGKEGACTSKCNSHCTRKVLQSPESLGNNSGHERCYVRNGDEDLWAGTGAGERTGSERCI